MYSEVIKEIGDDQLKELLRDIFAAWVTIMYYFIHFQTQRYRST